MRKGFALHTGNSEPPQRKGLSITLTQKRPRKLQKHISRDFRYENHFVQISPCNVFQTAQEVELFYRRAANSVPQDSLGLMFHFRNSSDISERKAPLGEALMPKMMHSGGKSALSSLHDNKESFNVYSLQKLLQKRRKMQKCNSQADVLICLLTGSRIP